MWINKERTEDMRRGWQSSMKATAGSDILHKPGDASGMMEATSRVKRETGRRGRWGVRGVRYRGFCLQIPVLISSVPHTRPPASLAAWSWRLVPTQKNRVFNVWEEKLGQHKGQKGMRSGDHVWRWADPSVSLQPTSQWRKRQWSRANGNSGGGGEGEPVHSPDTNPVLNHYLQTFINQRTPGSGTECEGQTEKSRRLRHTVSKVRQITAFRYRKH